VHKGKVGSGHQIDKVHFSPKFRVCMGRSTNPYEAEAIGRTSLDANTDYGPTERGMD